MTTAGKAAIVTGAASGLGRAMALGLVGSGFNVVAVDRDAAGLATLKPAGAGNPAGAGKPAGVGRTGAVLPHVADLARPDSFEAITAAALKEFGGIDVLVNNAGIGQASVKADQRRNPIRFWDITPEQWSRFVTVNATAPIMMARAVVPHMLRARQGRVITVTTSLGTMVREGYLLYGSSKAAAESAMAVLAADLEGTGVTSNILVPGGVTNTPLVGDEAGDRAKMLQPDIMVPPLLWLVSDAAAGVNGRRFIAADWDRSLPEAQAAEKAGAPIAWRSIARMPIEPR
jgi:NAD(P)-dependent dehydrogenase (short-subunit alcohol dehydrogenase family)